MIIRRNVSILCPIIVPFLINAYRSPSKLFLGGAYILSQEGITQGDPLGMVMFTIGTLPLIHQIQRGDQQAWYAHDATAGEMLTSLRKWWDRLQALGPQFGYWPNPSKAWLVVKPDNAQTAEECFQHRGIKITMQGARILGSALGVRPFEKKFVRDRVSCWVTEVKNLCHSKDSPPRLPTPCSSTACPVSGAFSCVPFQTLGPSCSHWRMRSGTTFFRQSQGGKP